MDQQALIDAILHMKWLPLAIIVIGYLTRLLTDESKFPVSVPARWRPVVVVVLGQLYGCLMLAENGATWKTVVVTGLVTSFVTMGLFDLLVKAVFNGQPPWWVDVLALIFPSNPTKPVDTNAAKKVSKNDAETEPPPPSAS